MGIHQLCLEQFLPDPNNDRERLSIALHERVETIMDTIDGMMCIDMRIRYDEQLDRISDELAKILKIANELGRP